METLFSFGFVLLFVSSVQVACGDTISVIPATDQFVPIDSPHNLTFNCTISPHRDGRGLFWHVNGKLINYEPCCVRTTFERIGIYLDRANKTDSWGGVEVHLIITRRARLYYLRSDYELRVMCRTTNLYRNPTIPMGPLLSVRSYGVPLPPGNLHLETSNGTTLIWSRPANIHKDMGVNYTVTVESSVSTRQFTVIERAHLSHDFLEQSLSNPGECEAFRFHVVAHVAGVNDSQPATLNGTLPHVTDVTFLDESLRVVGVDLYTNYGAKAEISFKPVNVCTNYPIKFYTPIIDGKETSITIKPTPGAASVKGVLSTYFLNPLVINRTFEVGVKACSDVACGTSATVPLNTTDIQTARAVFFNQFMFLNCSLADSSIAMSCRFIIHFQHGGVQTQSNMYFGLCYYTPYPFYPSTVTATAVFFEHDLTQHPVRVDSTIATSWFEYLVLTGCLGSVDITRNPGRSE